jgi:hypothetical protein
MREYDPDAFKDEELDGEALDLALTAAEDAVHAGMDPHDQLVYAIKAYQHYANVNEKIWNR